jgi:hypothetical protein
MLLVNRKEMFKVNQIPSFKFYTCLSYIVRNYQKTLTNVDLRTTMVYRQKALDVKYFKRLRRFYLIKFLSIRLSYSFIMNSTFKRPNFMELTLSIKVN